MKEGEEGKKAKKHTLPIVWQKKNIFYTSQKRRTTKWYCQSSKVETETCFRDFSTLKRQAPHVTPM